MKIKELEQLTGGLSKPSKMPGFAYSLPATRCILGSILAKKKGSVCSGCYALKGRYVFSNVTNAMERRFQAWKNNPDWVRHMIELIGKKYRKKTGKDRVFRWHDSGDLQGPKHISDIVEIAYALPDIQFWLPTRENRMVSQWLSCHCEFPPNLLVRVSMQMVGQKMTRSVAAEHIAYSTVGSSDGFACPAPKQGNECGDCRACWDPSVESVDYSLH